MHFGEIVNGINKPEHLFVVREKHEPFQGLIVPFFGQPVARKLRFINNNNYQ